MTSILGTVTSTARWANREKFMCFLKNIGSPIVGFGVGWVSWSLLDHYEVVSYTQQQQIYLLQLKGERLCHRTLPSSVIEVIGMKPLSDIEDNIENLKRDIARGQCGEPQDQRLGFREALRECHIKDQLDWLEEHIQEEIPYFYIADLFDGFARVHEDLLKKEDNRNSQVSNPSIGGDSQNGEITSSDSIKIEYKKGDPSFVSEAVCKGMFAYMCKGVIPFDVSVRVLAVMAYMNPHNAAIVANCKDVGGDIVAREVKYADSDEEKQISSLACNPPTTSVECISFLYAQYLRNQQMVGISEGDEIVPPSLVDIATIQLLKAIDEVSIVKSSWAKPWVKPTLSFPALRSSKPFVKASICRGLEKVNTLPVDTETMGYANRAFTVLNCGNESPVASCALSK